MIDPLWPEMAEHIKSLEANSECRERLEGTRLSDYLIKRYMDDPADFYTKMLGPLPSVLTMLYPQHRHSINDFTISVVASIHKKLALIPSNTHVMRDGVLVKLTDDMGEG